MCLHGEYHDKYTVVILRAYLKWVFLEIATEVTEEKKKKKPEQFRNVIVWNGTAWNIPVQYER